MASVVEQKLIECVLATSGMVTAQGELIVQNAKELERISRTLVAMHTQSEATGRALGAFLAMLEAIADRMDARPVPLAT